MQQSISGLESAYYNEYTPPPIAIEPRPYQDESMVLLREKVSSTIRSLLLVLPGGAGKTVIAAMLLKNSKEKGAACVFIAHRRELIKQAQRKFKQYGIQSGIIMGTEKADHAKDIQIASIQTLARREMPAAKLVIIDEGHRALGAQYKKVVQYYIEKGAVVIGLTGTPFRTNKKESLKDVYHDFVANINCSELLALGYLTPAKVVGVPNSISTKGMHSSKGDFLDKELMMAFDKHNAYLNLISNYEKWGKDKKAIMFCCSVEHSIKSVEALNSAGYPARHIDGETPQAERDEIVRKYSSGEILILSNYGILAEGFDVPDTEVIIFNTATQSRIKWLQACWRGSRIAEGKAEYIVIDMADNCEKRFGYPDQDIEVSLEAEDTELKEKGLAPCKMCKQCYLVLPVSAKYCKECGFVFPEKKHKVGEHEFQHLDRDSKYRKWNYFSKKDWHKVPDEELEEFAKYKNFKPAWVNMEKERRKLGHKFVKIEGFTGEKHEMYSICNALQKKYYQKKPIDATMFVFLKETESEIIFKYVAATEVI